MSEYTKQIEPTPLYRPLDAAPDVPLADLGPLIEPIEAITTLTQAPTALALQGILAAISVAAHSHANVETLLNPVPLSLFLFSVAGSGERKSAVDSLATKAIRDHEKPFLTQYAIDFARYEEAANAKGRSRDLSVVLDEGRDIAHDLSTTPPVCPKILFDDLTYEGVVRHFENGQPSIGMFSDEGGKIIGGHAMSPQNQLATIAALSNLWDGKDINKTRAGTGTISLANRRVALHLAVQPVIANKLFSNGDVRDQGFLSRVLVTMPDSRKGDRFFDESEPAERKKQAARADMEKFYAGIRGLLERRPATDSTNKLELAPRTLTLETDARRRFINFCNAVEKEQGKDCAYENISGFASKAAEQAARIAGNIALFEDPDATEVRAKQMQVAISLMGYYLDEAVRIFDTGSVSESIQDAELLRQWIADKWKHEYVDITAVSRNGPNRVRSSKVISALFRLLEEHGWLQKVSETIAIDGRRSRKAFRVYRP